eukprot:GHVN01011504.1.p2 GENE.GHVN01011504.1~~GHVN01011504.1.p2  ORF type:complete len:108 (-),score=14.49 GHVN01011504.1:103-426(-)
MTLGGNTNTCSFNVVDEKVPVLISFPQQRKLKLVIDCERMVVSAKGMPEEIDIIYLAEEAGEDQDDERMGEVILEERLKEVGDMWCDRAKVRNIYSLAWYCKIRVLH